MAITDLPDWITQVSGIEAEAYTIRGGADANKSATPTARDVYLATDTKKLYVCVTDGAWTGFDASIIVQGIFTLYANMVGGGFEITGIKDPTAAQSAATKAYADIIDAKLDDVTVAQPTRLIDTIYQNTGGKLRLVVIAVAVQSTEYCRLDIGATSPPATLVDYLACPTVTAGTMRGNLVAIIPLNWYYQLVTVTATPAILKWTEEDLL